MQTKAELLASAVVADFIPVARLAELQALDRKSIYNQHSSRRGALVPILVKVGGRLGCWREDYECWKSQQRRLKPEAAERA